MSTKRVSGAGDSSYNGDYSGPDPKGPWVYNGPGGNRYLYFDTSGSSNTFFLNTSVANNGRGDYDQGYGTNASSPNSSVHVWETQYGTSPAPTVTDVVTAAPPRNLQMSVIY